MNLSASPFEGSKCCEDENSKRERQSFLPLKRKMDKKDPKRLQIKLITIHLVSKKWKVRPQRSQIKLPTSAWLNINCEIEPQGLTSRSLNLKHQWQILWKSKSTKKTNSG